MSQLLIQLIYIFRNRMKKLLLARNICGHLFGRKFGFTGAREEVWSAQEETPPVGGSFIFLYISDSPGNLSGVFIGYG